MEDKKSGKGNMAYNNDDRYKGDWGNDMKNGHGKDLINIRNNEFC